MRSYIIQYTAAHTIYNRKKDKLHVKWMIQQILSSTPVEYSGLPFYLQFDFLLRSRFNLFLYFSPFFPTAGALQPRQNAH